MKTKFYSLLTMGLLMAGVAYAGDPGSGTSVELKDWVPDAAKPSAVLQADGTIEISVIAPTKGSYNVGGVMGADEDLPSDCLMSIAVCKSPDASVQGQLLQMFTGVAPGETRSCTQTAVTPGTTYYYTTMIVNEAAAAALPDGTDPEYIISDPFELTVPAEVKTDYVPAKPGLVAEFNSNANQALIFLTMPSSYEVWSDESGNYECVSTVNIDKNEAAKWNKVVIYRHVDGEKEVMKSYERGGEGWPGDAYLAGGKVFPGTAWCMEDVLEDYDANKTYKYSAELFMTGASAAAASDVIDLAKELNVAVSANVTYKVTADCYTMTWDLDNETVTIDCDLPTIATRGSAYLPPMLTLDYIDQPLYQVILMRKRVMSDGTDWRDAEGKLETKTLTSWSDLKSGQKGVQFVDEQAEVGAYYRYYFVHKKSATDYGAYTPIPYPMIYTDPTLPATDVTVEPAEAENTVTISWTAPKLHEDADTEVSGYNVLVDEVQVNTELLTACTYDYTYAADAKKFSVVVETVYDNEVKKNTEAVEYVVPQPIEHLAATEVKAELSAEKDAVVVTWTAPAVAAENVKGYNVLVNGTKANEELLTECTFSYTIPEGAKKLSFVVQTVYVDDETANAEAVEFEVPEEPAPIEHLAATNVAAALSEDAKAILVTWTAPAVAAENLKGYNVLVDGTKANEALLTECSFRYPVPEKDADLSFVVQAVYTDDQTADSEAAVFKYSGIMLLTGDAEGLEIYTLQGVRVKNPGNGIFIIRQNGEVKKVGIRR